MNGRWLLRCYGVIDGFCELYLTLAVLAALKKLGINKTALVVFADNKGGIDFWKRMGFCLRNDIAYMDKSLNDFNK